MPKVSCILSSYNRPKGVVRAISSVLSQSFDDFELLVMDDGSNDATLSVLHSITDPRVRFFYYFPSLAERMSMVRYSCLINDALPFVRGEFVTYLTDDDYYKPLRFKKLVDAFSSRPNVLFIYNATEVHCQQPHVLRFHPQERVRLRPGIDHNSIMHRLSLLPLLSGPEYWPVSPGLYSVGDWVFMKKCDKVCRFHYVDDALTVHNLHARTITSLHHAGKLWQSEVRE